MPVFKQSQNSNNNKNNREIGIEQKYGKRLVEVSRGILKGEGMQVGEGEGGV